MTLAVELSAPGGVENLSVISRKLEDPGKGEIRIRQEGAGVNFIDIYQRTGLYPLPLPAILGVEGAGVIEAVGEGVAGLSVGDRVGYAGVVGGYAEARLLPAWRAIALPGGLFFEHAAASLLRAFTAHMLLRRVYPVGPGSTLLVHAGAGGLASLLIPWARRLGARVLATASSETKAARAIAHGAERVIVGRGADIAGAARDWTGGRGVDFTIDGIGGPTYQASLDATAKFGMFASIGQAAGAIADVSASDFGPGRSLAFSRPSVMAYLSDPATYRAAVPEVLQAVQAAAMTDAPRFPLIAAAEARRPFRPMRVLRFRIRRGLPVIRAIDRANDARTGSAWYLRNRREGQTCLSQEVPVF
ncbi:MAG: quinone oxidoreductase family protein [Paracoccus sp. (in: a-proteobacteria)]